MNYLINKDQVESFIPQRAPFVMVDELREVKNEEYTTSFAILSDNIFLDGPYLREFALIENITQSCALGVGYVNRFSNIKAIDGFLGGISKLNLFKLPEVDDRITTVVKQVHRFDNLYLFKGTNYIQGEILLECEIKLVGMMT